MYENFFRPPQQSPGHISVVTSPFLLHNKVQLKVPRTTTTPSTGNVVLNFIKQFPDGKQNKNEQKETDNQEVGDDVEPHFLKNSSPEERNKKSLKHRSKRWVPLMEKKKMPMPRQIPQEDTFLNSLLRLPNESPLVQNGVPQLAYVPGKGICFKMYTYLISIF